MRSVSISLIINEMLSNSTILIYATNNSEAALKRKKRSCCDFAEDEMTVGLFLLPLTLERDLILIDFRIDRFFLSDISSFH